MEETKTEPDIRELILWLNTNYGVVRDKPRGFRREGEKDIVEAEIRIFNGVPQVVFFYGKTRYTFNLLKRIKPDRVLALTRIMGFKGIENLPPELLKKFFSENEIKLRAAWLKEKGI